MRAESSRSTSSAQVLRAVVRAGGVGGIERHARSIAEESRPFHSSGFAQVAPALDAGSESVLNPPAATAPRARTGPRIPGEFRASQDQYRPGARRRRVPAFAEERQASGASRLKRYGYPHDRCDSQHTAQRAREGHRLHARRLGDADDHGRRHQMVNGGLSGAADRLHALRNRHLRVAVAMAARLGGIATLRTQRLGGHAPALAVQPGDHVDVLLRPAGAAAHHPIAIGYAAPLFMTALSVPLLRERVGWRRWLAVVVGLPRRAHRGATFSRRHQRRRPLRARCRAVLCAHPGHVAAAQHDREQPHDPVLLLAVRHPGAQRLDAVGVGDTALEGSLADPVRRRRRQLRAVLPQPGHALRRGSLLAPLDYSGLVWAGLLGFIVWGDIPTPVVLAGSAIIVSAGIYIVRREAILRRRGAQAAATAPGLAAGL